MNPDKEAGPPPAPLGAEPSKILFNIKTRDCNASSKNPMPYFVYILQCADGTLYAGYTKNLEKRLNEHNSSKKGAHYTKIRRPVKLVYSETFKTLSLARRKEEEIKSWRREKKMMLVKKYSLQIIQFEPKKSNSQYNFSNPFRDYFEIFCDSKQLKKSSSK